MLTQYYKIGLQAFKSPTTITAGIQIFPEFVDICLFSNIVPYSHIICELFIIFPLETIRVWLEEIYTVFTLQHVSAIQVIIKRVILYNTLISYIITIYRPMFTISLRGQITQVIYNVNAGCNSYAGCRLNLILIKLENNETYR